MNRRSVSNTDGHGYSSAGTAGLTLVEFLVVLAIIGVVNAFLLPAFQSVREARSKTYAITEIEAIVEAASQHYARLGKAPRDIDALSAFCKRHQEACGPWTAAGPGLWGDSGGYRFSLFPQVDATGGAGGADSAVGFTVIAKPADPESTGAATLMQVVADYDGDRVLESSYGVELPAPGAGQRREQTLSATWQRGVAFVGEWLGVAPEPNAESGDHALL